MIYRFGYVSKKQLYRSTFVGLTCLYDITTSVIINCNYMYVFPAWIMKPSKGVGKSHDHEIRILDRKNSYEVNDVVLYSYILTSYRLKITVE